MSSVNISIKKEAYEFLKTMKTDERSFSDVILSFKKEPDLMRFHGALRATDWNLRAKEHKALRQEFER
jgi:predicted CopG family antitoxin